MKRVYANLRLNQTHRQLINRTAPKMRIKKIHLRLLWVFLMYLRFQTGFAQCLSQASNHPSSISTDNSVGSIDWINPQNASTADGNSAIATALVLGDKTYFLQAKNFNFSIPTSASICGITVEIKKKAFGILQNVHDNEVKIIKGGTISGNNLASVGTVWPTSAAYFTHGSTSENWGLTWTPTDINSADFGVAISVNLAGISVLPTAFIDDIRIVVNYQTAIVLPLNLLSFEGKRLENEQVKLSWTTQNELNNAYFTLEKSLDGQIWEELTTIQGSKNSQSLKNYTLIDERANQTKIYYRLSQTDIEGGLNHLKVIAVQVSKNEQVKIYPNPNEGDFQIFTQSGISKVEIYHSSGKRVAEFHPACTTNLHENYHYSFQKMSSGLYNVKIMDCQGNMTYKKMIVR